MAYRPKSKIAANKINAATTAPKNGSKSKKVNRSTSYCSLLIKMLMYSIVIGLLAIVAMKYQFPKHYKGVEDKVSPLFVSVADKISPYFKYCQSQTMEIYMSTKPYVIDVTEKIQNKSMTAFTYIYGKIDEVAPQLVVKINEISKSVENYSINLYNALSTYLNSKQFQDSLESVKNQYNRIISSISSVFGY